ncbi:MAG: hypothetical protein KDD39_00660 [Bdellovibrionales bacterium]|nr:hypothetical protein [Bdellovibrionales bacterium]
MKTGLKFFLTLAVALALPALADNPLASASRTAETLKLKPALEGEVLSLIIREARAGKSAQELVTARLVRAGYAPDVAAAMWNSNTLVVGGLSAIEGLAKTQITAGKLNAEELVPFLTSEGFNAKASPIQVVRTMLDGKTNITKATFVASLAKADEALASQNAAPKLPTKTDEEYVNIAKRVVMARPSTFPDSVVISPAQAALAKDEAEVTALRDSWESNFKEGEDAIEQLAEAADQGDAAARTKLINIGTVAAAVESQGCPLNKRNLGQVPENCVAPLAFLQNWAQDTYIQGPATKERALVGVNIVTGWGHSDPNSVKKGGALIEVNSIRTKGESLKQPRNVPAARCLRGEAYAVAN